jgi:hypothetical protein
VQEVSVEDPKIKRTGPGVSRMLMQAEEERRAESVDAADRLDATRRPVLDLAMGRHVGDLTRGEVLAEAPDTVRRLTRAPNRRQRRR